MIRVAVVGLGMMGRHHTRLYSGMTGCELVGVADINPARGGEISERYHTKYYADYRELIGQVDAVSVAVPTTKHCQIATAFLKQGIHCLVEKPIAANLVEANRMVETAEKHHTKLAIGHIERFNPAVSRLKELIDRGDLGQLLIISTRRVGPFMPRIRDVGVVIDSGTHDIDVARYLTGKEPVRVYACTGKLHHEQEDHAVLMLDFASTTACIEVNWFTPNKIRKLVATGSKGIAYLDYISQELKVRNSQSTIEWEVAKAEPLRCELSHFLKCIEDDFQPLVNGREGLQVLKIALTACEYINPMMSHKVKKRVTSLA